VKIAPVLTRTCDDAPACYTIVPTRILLVKNTPAPPFSPPPPRATGRYVSMSSATDPPWVTSANRQAWAGAKTLMLLGGNPLSNKGSFAGNALLMAGGSRGVAGGGDVEAPFVVSFREECSPGCRSSSWPPAYALVDSRQNLYCEPMCNTSACAWDGGDCLFK
jgi:hypothetical protein